MASLNQQGKNKSKSGNKRSNDDLDDDEPSGGLGKRKDRPRGKKLSKEDLKCEASTIALQESLKGMIAVKETSSAKRGQIRESRKDERFKGLVEVLREKHRHDVAATKEKLRIEAELATASWMQLREPKRLISRCS
jgi:hypothetical protein